MGNQRNKYTDEEWDELENFKKTIEENQTDPIVDKVRKDLLNRSEIGILKYKTNLGRKDLLLKDWLQHAYEECLDQSLYLKRAILEIDEKS